MKLLEKIIHFLAILQVKVKERFKPEEAGEVQKSYDRSELDTSGRLY